MDRDAIRQTMEDWLEMAANTATIGSVAVADQLGVFAQLATPRSAAELADSNGWSVRHLEELLFSLTAGGIVTHANGVFSLPETQATILADPTSPYFLAGQARALADSMGRAVAVADSIRTGAGIDPASLPEEATLAQERLNGPSQRILLAKKWITALPDIVERLEAGGEVADVGCGAGIAAEALAERFPNSSVTGYDLSSDAISRARARTDGTLTNLTFEETSITELPSGHFDFVLTFDVIHDLGDPLGGLESIRGSLTPDGAFLMIEPNAAASVDDNIHPLGALLYGMSAMHCVPVALAYGDEGLGACWGPEKAEQYARQAGFTRFERLPIKNLANAFYRLGR